MLLVKSSQLEDVATRCLEDANDGVVVRRNLQHGPGRVVMERAAGNDWTRYPEPFPHVFRVWGEADFLFDFESDVDEVFIRMAFHLEYVEKSG
ncbi:hypothetical protein SAMN02799626_04986 [Caulobacter sp. UNC279MFTsu5.1]|nr:hypothetical protein SAMN02799626_04986 [Caulobacter sp. UNC279MFTsu5.1]